MNHLRLGSAAVALACAVFVSSASALDIDIDYSDDTTGFFAGNATAKAALEKAAADLSAAITTTLGATVDTNSATVNGSNANTNYSFNYTHPTFGSAAVVANAVMPADTVRVFVGVQNLGGNTLGQGGPGGLGLGGGFLNADPTDFAAAVNQLEADANANHGRGGGPTIGQLNTTFDTEPFVLDFGSSTGNIWFDVDSDNDTITDGATLLDTYWHFDHTTPVAAGKNDFYSVALHELIHAIGFSAADSYTDLQTGNDWAGGEVIALVGTGTDILELDGAHVLDGGGAGNFLQTKRLSDGVLQDAVMDPTLTAGTRKTLTELDLAFLRDIGWETIPEPTSLALLVVGGAALLRRRAG